MGFALAVAAVALVGLRLHLRTPPAGQKPVPVKAGHQTVTPLRITISNPIKMVTVAVRPPRQQSAFNPARNSWSGIEIIVDDNSEYEKRLEAISHLPRVLTAADWAALKGFLLKADSLDGEQLNQVVKNELMDALCAMDPSPAGLGNALAQMYGNLAQNEVIRDYAVQHLATVDEMLAVNGGQGIAQEEQTDQQVLWNALGETGDSISGTALLGLVRLSQQPNANIDQSKLDAAALQLVNDKAAGELAQITACQVCAQLNLQTALPAIEAAAQDSQNIPLQISAIGSLGLLGGTQDLSILQALLKSNEERLELPVQTAISQIEIRQNHMVSQR